MDKRTSSEKQTPRRGIASSVLIAIAIVMIAVVAAVVIHHTDGVYSSKEDMFTVGALSYKVTSSDDMTVKVCKYNEDYSHVDIPSHVEYKGMEYTVTAIGEKTFCGYMEIKPEGGIGLSYIELYSLTIPETVVTIENRAIYATKITSLTIPASVQHIHEEGIFKNGYLEELVLLCEDANLEKKSLDNYDLVNLTLPISLNVAGTGDGAAFDKLSDLKYVTFTKGSGIGHDYSDDKKSKEGYYADTPWVRNEGSIISIELEDGIKHIGNNMFRDMDEMKHRDIPVSVKSIGDYAFEGCSELVELNLPLGLESLGNGCFKDCTTLDSIEIPSRVKIIPARTFENCSGAENIYLPNEIESIGDYAFMKCGSLSNFDIPLNATELGKYAFAECTKMETVTMHSGISEIKDSTFKDCVSLTYIFMSENLGSIGNNAFMNCMVLKHVVFQKGGELTIGTDAFSNCPSDLEFTTEKDGFELQLFLDKGMTESFSRNIKDFSGTLYLNLTEKH